MTGRVHSDGQGDLGGYAGIGVPLEIGKGRITEGTYTALLNLGGRMANVSEAANDGVTGWSTTVADARLLNHWMKT